MPFIFAVPKNIFRLVEERILFGSLVVRIYGFEVFFQ